MLDTRTPLQTLASRWPRLFRGEPPADSDLMPGWLGIVDRACADIDALLTDAEVAFFEVWRVAEKFGTLRFDCRLPLLDDPARFAQLERIIDDAEERSGKTCMVCGAAGSRRMSGWVVTMCDEHHEEPARRRGVLAQE